MIEAPVVRKNTTAESGTLLCASVANVKAAIILMCIDQPTHEPEHQFMQAVRDKDLDEYDHVVHGQHHLQDHLLQVSINQT